MIALALTLAAAAAVYQDNAGLDRAVAAFTGRAIGDDGGARTTVDPRLKLAACPTVALSWRTDAHDAVVVACAGPDWRIFVPVRMAAQTAVIARATPAAPAASAEKVIRRGDPVTIEAGSDGFAITRDGVAMGDAAAGQRLMIRVADSTAPVQGVALAAGRATLPGWND